MRRVLIYDRFDAQVCELSENDVFELTRHEVVNGAHELTITTTQVLEKGYRVLMEDDRGYWHEWCVSGIDEQHANGSRPYGSYYCVWSLQPDLMGTRVSAMPGVQTPVIAAQALDAALGGTSRWTRGTITNTNTGGASMYDTDGWSAMSTLVANWGGEVDTTIGVSTLSGVVSRQVDLYAQQGESTAKRRFDFGADLVSVRRTMADDPLYCRITPRGKGEQTGGGYGRKITIESVNDGKDYLENASMVDLAKLPDGNGGWEYPTLEVENSDCATPADLLTWAQSVLDAYTNPKVTYEINVVQAAREGIDLQGVSLGDAVQIVDGKFNDLRLTGRVMEMAIDELAHTTTQLTIGSVSEGISERFSDLYSGIRAAGQSVTQLAQSLSTADYIDSLLDRINAEINATGGYAYIVPGNGILTFDVAVADPLNPVEASRVVEIKGGTMRIANSKTAQGQWEWKTVFTSGHVAAELVTAAELVAGYIGSPASGNYWNLDTGDFRMAATSMMGDVSVQDVIDGYEATISAVDVQYAQNNSATTAPTSGWQTNAPQWRAGYYIWQRTATTTPNGVNYSMPVMISGRDGEDGIGVSAVVEQYYLSTSNTTQTGGSWSTSQPTWASGKYIWTRSKVTWSDNTTTYTGPVLAKAINGANQEAKNASTAVTTLDNSLDQTGVFNRLTKNGALQGLYMSGGKLYINGTYIQTGKISSHNGKVYFDLDNNEIACDKLVSTDSGSKVSVTVAKRSVGGSNYDYSMSVSSTQANSKTIYISPNRGQIVSDGNLTISGGSSYGSGVSGSTWLEINGSTFTFQNGQYSPINKNGQVIFNMNSFTSQCNSNTLTGSLTVSGTKSRVVETENYADRLLYCYETPTPMFGDIGSGAIGEDGTCVVSIDDVFSETARTDIKYQVFLQACGQGDLYVGEKSQTHFTVCGTPGLPFDWEIKCKQMEYEHLRLETPSLQIGGYDDLEDLPNPEAAHGDYVNEIESLLLEGETA